MLITEKYLFTIKAANILRILFHKAPRMNAVSYTHLFNQTNDSYYLDNTSIDEPLKINIEKCYNHY